MKSRKLFAFTATIIFCLVFCFTAFSQTQPKTYESREEASKKGNGGITFKIPDGVMTAQWGGFKGLLMIEPEHPSGIFIAYPNDKESIEKLISRAEKSIADFFIHDEKKSSSLAWKIKSIPSHSGDSKETALMKTSEDDEHIIQVTFYEREWNNLNLIYGYFAMRRKNKEGNNDEAVFLNEKGEGSKRFDEFWKTFPSK